MKNLDVKSKNESIATEKKSAAGSGGNGFFMFNPVLLQQSLQKNFVPGIKHMMVFQNIEGSIVAKASQTTQEQFDKQLVESQIIDPQRSLNSYAAILAQICHEYIGFGQEAFDD